MGLLKVRSWHPCSPSDKDNKMGVGVLKVEHELKNEFHHLEMPICPARPKRKRGNQKRAKIP